MKKHKKILIIFILFFAINIIFIAFGGQIICFFKQFYNWAKNIDSNFSDFITSVTAVLSAFIAFITYFYSKKQSKTEKAIEFAKIFCDEIVPISTELIVKFEPIISKIDKYIEIQKISDFTIEELTDLITKDELIEIIDFINDEKLNEKMITLLNKLEYLSMYIKNNLANDKVIYQSLHQIFLSSVKLCYIQIALRNRTKYDEVYTNIIYVYNKWKDILENKKIKEEKE